ncbi:MAG: hypothetical protein A3K09_02975 [Nitrospinae bacterium RIFCSPLOWO2_12_FULL_47_7]|nr:MAG: hypothetical protein A3K09_02975 [Nitrospinae bacterium RIFCSPLOWO2_12_FULL_47_7]
MIFSFFVVMIMVAVFHKDGILTVNDFKEEQRKLKESNVTLEQENQRIALEIEELKTEPFAIEKLAREKLNLVKPGETVYQIVREKNETPTLVHP